VPLLVAAPVAWTAFEWLRSWVATGFPWLLLGHSQWSRPALTRVAAFVGVYGLSFAMACTNAALAEILLLRLRRPGDRGPASRRWWWVPAAALAAVFAASLTHALGPSGPPLRVALVQGNVPQMLKEQALEEERLTTADILRRHVLLSRDAVASARERWGSPPDLVIWPETMIPGRFRPGAPAEEATMREVARLVGAPLLAGALTYGGPESDDLYNAALLFDREGRLVGRYDKAHIVPGGEYVPLRGVLPEDLVDWIGGMIRDYAGFLPALSEGERVEPVEIPGNGTRAGPLVCYDVIYPGLSRAHARAGAHLLVNLTNYGWFGESAELEQANAIAAFRAVETGLPVIVVANTGISCVLLPDGTPGPVLERGGRRKSVEGTLLAEVPVRRDDPATTVSTRIGDLFAILLASLTGVLLSWAIWSRIRERKLA
jgi:apolipoprotein N-acyltransferase